MGKILTLKSLESGASICVDLDDLFVMMRMVAAEKGIDIGKASAKQKREVLKSMGYAPYFSVLKKEAGFEWL
jgi:hypothetical protein